MKAIVCTAYGPPDVLQLREVEKPAPGNGDVLIKVFATAVTASDCIVRGAQIPIWSPMGLMMRLALGFTKPRQPILGIVLAGEVETVGRAVSSFKPGDQVFGWDLFPTFGAYAEYKRMRASGILAMKPANVDYAEAAAIPYGGLLASSYLKRGNIQAGQRVLIYGASGAVGTLAVQLARHFGAKVTGVCSTTNLKLVKSLGADSVIDYTREQSVDNGKSYDLILDAVGERKSSSLKKQCRQALAPNGKYISVDNGSPEIGVEDLVLLKELVEAGEIKPVIDRRYPLEQMAEAHRYVDQGHKKGNVIITVAHGGTV
jgi:NADPH:quinone reductase-like Zn-dependent oxidoreductase